MEHLLKIFIVIFVGKKAKVEIYPLVWYLIPLYDSEHIRNFDWVQVDDCSTVNRYREVWIVVTFLFLKVYIHKNEKTEVGKIYHKGYYFKNDPEHQVKFAKLVESGYYD
jgi:hypothetical protein